MDDDRLREHLLMTDSLYASLKHIDGIGRASDYSDSELIVLAKKLQLEKNLTEPKVAWKPFATDKHTKTTHKPTQKSTTKRFPAKFNNSSLKRPSPDIHHSKGSEYYADTLGARPKPNSLFYNPATSQQFSHPPPLPASPSRCIP